MPDLGQAQAKARAENRLVFLDFTGSDRCMKLDKEILSTLEFADYARKNLMLVEVEKIRKNS